MPLATLALLGVAALVHAAWNAAAKAARGNPFVFVWANATTSTFIYLPIAVVVIWKDPTIGVGTIALAAIVSGILHIIYSLTLQTGYAHGDLGVVYPTARGVGPLVTMIVAVTIFGERITLSQTGGALLIITGVMVVAASPGRNVERLRIGVKYGVLTGIAIASYTLWDNYAVNAWAMHPVVLFVFSHGLQAGFMTPGAWRRRHHWPVSLKPNATPIILVALLAPISYILVLYAMTTAPVALVAPVRETSIVIGAILGWLIFKEPRPLGRLLGAALVVGGVGLLTLA